MIYVHIPFCKRKCLYCDFFSVCTLSLADDYTQAVINEINKTDAQTVETIYIGGGTPTVLGDNLVRIVNALRERFPLAENYEFTVEANPGAVSGDLLKRLYASGVNRISLGVQSFNDDELKALGRIHSSDDAHGAIYDIQNAGFTNFSLDLMLAIPKQTKKSLAHTLDEIEKINPPHVSAYSLIVEENTPFYEMELDLCDEDSEREFYYYAGKRLGNMGLKRYEISNFAKKGFESVHNLHYWQDYEYTGIGAGAHSFKNLKRFNNVCNIEKYIQNQPCYENITKISPKERQLELFMLGLRMTEGIRYNGEFEDRVQPLIKKGLLEIQNGYLRLTERGTDLANLVFMEFLDD